MQTIRVTEEQKKEALKETRKAMREHTGHTISCSRCGARFTLNRFDFTAEKAMIFGMWLFGKHPVMSWELQHNCPYCHKDDGRKIHDLIPEDTDLKHTAVLHTFVTEFGKFKALYRPVYKAEHFIVADALEG